MCEQEAFLCCTKLQKIKVINALTSIRHVSTCLSCPNTHARLFNWATCAAQFIPSIFPPVWREGGIPGNLWWGCAV